MEFNFCKKQSMSFRQEKKLLTTNNKLMVLTNDFDVF